MNKPAPTTFEWVDGDPLMEAIAHAVWAQCSTEGTSLVVDDPRNIAAVAATAARAAVRAETLRDAEEICDEAGAVYTSKSLNEQAAGAYELMERFRRKAEEAEQMAAASAVVAPPTDQAACDCEAEVHMGVGFYHQPECATKQPTVLPEPTDRAAVLLWAAEVAESFDIDASPQAVAAELRRLAVEAHDTGTQQAECAASISGSCLAEAQSERPCDTDDGECVHGGRPAGAQQQPDIGARAEEPPTEEQMVRDHVTTLHLIGEQLTRVESWMWAHLADVRDAQAAQQQPETEAHPAEHGWAAELYDPVAEEWVPGTRYLIRAFAVSALEHGRRIGPTWKDDTPTQRRLVRATTTYTVEEPAPVAQQPAAEAEQDDTMHACPGRWGGPDCHCFGDEPAPARQQAAAADGEEA